jgi:hypothetical protein
MADIESFAKLTQAQMVQAAQALFAVGVEDGHHAMVSAVAVIAACARAQALLCVGLNIDPHEFDDLLEEAVKQVRAHSQARPVERLQ